MSQFQSQAANRNDYHIDTGTNTSTTTGNNADTNTDTNDDTETDAYTNTYINITNTDTYPRNSQLSRSWKKDQNIFNLRKLKIQNSFGTDFIKLFWFRISILSNDTKRWQ